MGGVFDFGGVGDCEADFLDFLGEGGGAGEGEEGC